MLSAETQLLKFLFNRHSQLQLVTRVNYLLGDRLFCIEVEISDRCAEHCDRLEILYIKHFRFLGVYKRERVNLSTLGVDT